MDKKTIALFSLVFSNPKDKYSKYSVVASPFSQVIRISFLPSQLLSFSEEFKNRRGWDAPPYIYLPCLLVRNIVQVP